MWPHTATTLPSISAGLPSTPRDTTPDTWNLGRRRQFNASGGSGRSTAPQTARHHWRNQELPSNQDPDMVRLAYERNAYSFFEGMKGEFVKEAEALKEQYEANNAMQVMTLQDQVYTLKRQINDMNGIITKSLRDVAQEELSAISPANPAQTNSFQDQLQALKEGVQMQPGGLQDQLFALKHQISAQEGTSVQIRSIQDQVFALKRQIQASQENSVKKPDEFARDEFRSICAQEVEKALEAFLRGQQLEQFVKRRFESEVSSLERMVRAEVSSHCEELRKTNAACSRRVDEVAGLVDACNSTTALLTERVAILESQTPQHRVGTANAKSWLERAREQLDDFGRSLKDSEAKAGNPAAEQLLKSMAKARLALDTTSMACSSPSPPWGQRPQGPDRPPLPNTETPDFGEGGGYCGRMSGRRRRNDIFDEGLSSGDEALQSRYQMDSGDDRDDLRHAGAPDESEDEVRGVARDMLEAALLGDGGANTDTEPEGEDELKAKARGFLEDMLLGGDCQGHQNEEEMKARARAALDNALLSGDESGALSGGEGDDLAARAREHLEALLLGNDGGKSDGDKNSS